MGNKVTLTSIFMNCRTFSAVVISFLGACLICAADVDVPALLKSNLVRPDTSKQDTFSSYSSPKPCDSYLVYFSAHWCSPCKHFTPKLVEFYNDKKLSENGIEVIFVSNDFTRRDMWSYMTNVPAEKSGKPMPWPALTYGLQDREDFFNKLAGSGIPNLVWVSATGKVLASTFDGSKYLGPQFVLDRVAAMLRDRQKTATEPTKIPLNTTDDLKKALGMPEIPTQGASTSSAMSSQSSDAAPLTGLTGVTSKI